MPTDSKFQLRVASPCKAPWEAMDGDDRVRFCRECNRNVYNLSVMTETEARRVVAEREGRLCIRFYQRRDGTVLTSDCPVGKKRSFLWAGARTVVAIAGVAAGLTKLSACGSAEDEPVPMGEPLNDPRHPDELLMGEIEISPEQLLMGKIAHPSESE